MSMRDSQFNCYFRIKHNSSMAARLERVVAYLEAACATTLDHLSIDSKSILRADNVERQPLLAKAALAEDVSVVLGNSASIEDTDGCIVLSYSNMPLHKHRGNGVLAIGSAVTDPPHDTLISVISEMLDADTAYGLGGRDSTLLFETERGRSDLPCAELLALPKVSKWRFMEDLSLPDGLGWHNYWSDPVIDRLGVRHLFTEADQAIYSSRKTPRGWSFSLGPTGASFDNSSDAAQFVRGFIALNAAYVVRTDSADRQK